MIINVDADLTNADWVKKTWDLPYKSEEELKEALGDRYEEFKHLPVYAARPWAKKSVKDAAAELLKRL